MRRAFSQVDVFTDEPYRGNPVAVVLQGNGLSTEYGLVPLWGIARLLRIAPVNREMVLNYVAQHSLGLPRSY